MDEFLEAVEARECDRCSQSPDSNANLGSDLSSMLKCLKSDLLSEVRSNDSLLKTKIALLLEINEILEAEARCASSVSDNEQELTRLNRALAEIDLKLKSGSIAIPPPPAEHSKPALSGTQTADPPVLISQSPLFAANATFHFELDALSSLDLTQHRAEDAFKPKEKIVTIGEISEFPAPAVPVELEKEVPAAPEELVLNDHKTEAMEMLPGSRKTRNFANLVGTIKEIMSRSKSSTGSKSGTRAVKRVRLRCKENVNTLNSHSFINPHAKTPAGDRSLQGRISDVEITNRDAETKTQDVVVRRVPLEQVHAKFSRICRLADEA